MYQKYCPSIKNKYAKQCYPCNIAGMRQLRNILMRHWDPDFRLAVVYASDYPASNEVITMIVKHWYLYNRITINFLEVITEEIKLLVEMRPVLEDIQEPLINPSSTAPLLPDSSLITDEPNAKFLCLSVDKNIRARPDILFTLWKMNSGRWNINGRLPNLLNLNEGIANYDPTKTLINLLPYNLENITMPESLTWLRLEESVQWNGLPDLTQMTTIGELYTLDMVNLTDDVEEAIIRSNLLVVVIRLAFLMIYETLSQLKAHLMRFFKQVQRKINDLVMSLIPS